MKSRIVVREVYEKVFLVEGGVPQDALDVIKNKYDNGLIKLDKNDLIEHSVEYYDPKGEESEENI